MTTEQIDLITHSWEEVSQDPEIIANFYRKLFQIAPHTKRYFPEDLTKQSEKLAYTLGFVVGNIDRMETIVESIQDLGRKHRQLRIRDEEYVYVKDALLATIDEALPGDNEQVLAAWDEAITYLSQVMIDAPATRTTGRRTLWDRLFNRRGESSELAMEG